MNRRILLIVAALGCLLQAPVQAQSTAPGLAASPSGVVIVELVNLQCPRCRAVNDYVPQIERAARAAGADLRVAPLAWDGQSAWADRVYYAARDLFPGTENLVREVLFDGIQREGMRFEDLSQVLAYLERREVPKQLVARFPNFKMSEVAAYAGTDAPLLSEMKAGRLADLSMAQEVPVFVWVKNGEVVDSVSPATAADPLEMVQLVLKKLNKPATK